MKQHYNIALDGPVGAGKSTLADALAKALGILHLDTGAMYRAAAVDVLRSGTDAADEDAVTQLCETAIISVRQEIDGQHTLLNGEDVTGELRTEAVSLAASKIATYAGVRAAMVAAQRRIAAEASMLVDGRDIGFRVLPDADVKLFLTAAPEERARRRYLQLLEKGQQADYEQVLADLKKRDEQDSHRAVDPLHPAEDAIIVDTTGLTFEESLQRLLQTVQERLGE